MKKTLALLLASLMLFTACGAPTSDGKDTTAADETTAGSVDTTDPGNNTAPGTEEKYMETGIFSVEKSYTDVLTTPAADTVKVTDVEAKYIKKTENGFTYVAIEEPRIVISGFPFNDTNFIKYYRLEAGLFNKYPNESSGSVQTLAHHSSGGRVRFKTDAAQISIEVTTKNASRMQHMTWVGSMGCDVYVGSGKNRVYVNSVQPYGDASANTYMRTINLPAGTKEVEINLPLYAGIQAMNIGFPAGASLGSPDPYMIEDPIVFYGHSMTQGCSASRPGMSYPQIVTRALDANLVNMGFSGAAKGETIVAESIAKIKMSAFVMDYDCNASVDQLRATHYNFYKIIRNAHPDIPIVLVSTVTEYYKRTIAEAQTRRQIILDTYNRAKAEGDDNVYFINGSDIVPEGYRGDLLIDNAHMNDLGMFSLANAIYPVLKGALYGTEIPEYNKDAIFADGVFSVEKSYTDVLTTPAADTVKATAVDAKYIKKTENGFTYVDIEEPRMVLSGFPFGDTNFIKYYRLEAGLFNKYPSNPNGGDSVQKLAHHSTGGRVRFKTDAAQISIEVTTKEALRMQHMTWVGSMGCDVYVGSGKNRVYVNSLQPYSDKTANTYVRTVNLPAGTKEVEINLPLYAGIQSMSVGFPAGASLGSPDPYTIEDPIVFYGPSMLQGCSASRPGMSYPQIVTRALDANLVNMGFSSSAKGEQIVADSIAKIKMSAFVLDYDYNASIDELRATHYNFYKTIRTAHPDIPIILISAMTEGLSRTVEQARQRREIIQGTLERAKAEGDDNIYFINGSDLVPEGYRGDLVVDDGHSTDLGMFFMASAVYPILKEALGR